MPHPKANAVLAQLPDDEFDDLAPHMQLVSLKKGEILFEPGRSIQHYYFPVSCAVELAIDLEDGKSGATTFINMNSVYPLHLIGDTASQHGATVNCPGWCYKIPVRAMHAALQKSPTFLWVLLKESVRLFEQACLESVCLRHHSLEQVTAKLILLSIDNSFSSSVELTHQEMANALGVRREGVTLVLQKLKADHVIATHRGSVQVLDRTGLESRACGCYKSLADRRKQAACNVDPFFERNDR